MINVVHTHLLNKLLFIVLSLKSFIGDIRVTLGRENWTGLNENEVTVGVETSITHPHYDALTFDNDIGLLKLSTPVNFTAFIFPVCLAAAGSVIHTGTNSWATGWGVDANGKHVNLHSKSNQQG